MANRSGRVETKANFRCRFYGTFVMLFWFELWPEGWGGVGKGGGEEVRHVTNKNISAFMAELF